VSKGRASKAILDPTILITTAKEFFMYCQANLGGKPRNKKAEFFERVYHYVDQLDVKRDIIK
jgi:hypothetical protein